MSAFIGLGVPNWDIREAQMGTDMLVRNSFLGKSLADKLGQHPAALMRGHGSVVVGHKVQVAVGRTIYLDQNAKMQYQAMMMSGNRWKSSIWMILRLLLTFLGKSTTALGIYGNANGKKN
jgi:HCOMODA/2-hydroxy-3-carboxy-muconic semialdehyde decarboxylase